MTVGVNRKFRPRMLLLRPPRLSCSNACGPDSISSSWGIKVSSEHELLFGRLKIVVVPQLLAGNDLAHVADAARSVQAVHAQLAGEPTNVEIGHFGVHRVDAKRLDIAVDINGPVVHRVTEILPGVAEDHHASA